MWSNIQQSETGRPLFNLYMNLCVWSIPSDIAMLVLEKCTKENKDRDDIAFTMTFDYEFVEDFYTGTRKEPVGASNQIFGNTGTDSGDVYLGEDEDGEGVELQEVVTQTDGGKKTLQREKAGTKK